MKNMTLRDLFIKKLCVLYDVETSLGRQMPSMANAATYSDFGSEPEEEAADEKLDEIGSKMQKEILNA